MKCPLCACRRFYIKDPEDPFETLGFECTGDSICFDPEVEASNIPELTGNVKIFCDQCAWNGCLDELK